MHTRRQLYTLMTTRVWVHQAFAEGQHHLITAIPGRNNCRPFTLWCKTPQKPTGVDATGRPTPFHAAVH